MKFAQILADLVCLFMVEISYTFSATAETTGVCPDGWKQVGSLCYYLSVTDFDEPQSWIGANHECYIRGGNLILFETDNQTELVKVWLTVNEPVWVGYNSVEWSDGTSYNGHSVVYQKFERNEGKCVQFSMLKDDTVTLTNAGCSDKSGYICKRRLEDVSTIPNDLKVAKNSKCVGDNICYGAMEEKYSYNQAKLNCNGEWNLPVFDNNHQWMEFLQFKKSVSEWEGVWLGYRSDATDGEGRTVDLQVPKFLKKPAGAPAYSDYGSCTAAVWDKHAEWAHTGCSFGHNVICQKRTPVNTTESTPIVKKTTDPGTQKANLATAVTVELQPEPQSSTPAFYQNNNNVALSVLVVISALSFITIVVLLYAQLHRNKQFNQLAVSTKPPRTIPMPSGILTFE